MRKKLTLLACTAALAVVPASAAFAGPPEDIASQANCTLVSGESYATPGAMLKALTERDNHFQNTVDEWFDSVADLVHQKCTVGN